MNEWFIGANILISLAIVCTTLILSEWRFLVFLLVQVVISYGLLGFAAPLGKTTTTECPITDFTIIKSPYHLYLETKDGNRAAFFGEAKYVNRVFTIVVKKEMRNAYGMVIHTIYDLK